MPNIEGPISTPGVETRRHERLLWVLSAATFLIFFQAYMIAPLIPKLADMFHVSPQAIGIAIPVYMIPYGAATLFYGLLSDRLGRRPVILVSLLAFVAFTVFTATARTAMQLIGWRLVTGLGASGVVPVALALMGDLFPYEKRGRPLGWLFGAMAGGMAFGSTFGVLLEPLIGWRNLFVGVGALGLICLALLLRHTKRLGGQKRCPVQIRTASALGAYRKLLAGWRGARTYTTVLVNAIFHSGIYTWLGLYFAQRYRLGEIGIGLALLGYGVPGFILGPAIGRAADRWGRRWLIPAGLGIAALAGMALIFDMPVLPAALMVTVLSLGYDMTQPLLAGIVTTLDRERGGQAMGLNVFVLFTGFGLGSIIFGALLDLGFPRAFFIFSAAQFLLALAALPLYRLEKVPA
jgi:predicted MFS family arabinose efflux permease